jgi:hypothetical protein
VGLQRDAKIQIPCFQVCRLGGGGNLASRNTLRTYSSFQDSKCARDSGILFRTFQFPSFRVSKAPLWVRGRTILSRFLDSMCADSRILLRNIQIPIFQVCRFQDTCTVMQIPDSEFPSFRGPLSGPVWRYNQIPDSEFPSFRGPLLGPSPKDPQIPDSQFPSFRGPLLGPSPRDPQLPYSEFPSFRIPRTPLGSEPKGPPDSRFRVSEFPRTPLGSQQVRDPQISECRYT